MNTEDLIHIAGTIESIVYHNEENGYSVFDIENDEGKFITATGILPGICVGERVELYGDWVHHKTYGKQFRVDKFKKVLPKSKNNILKYLSSGAIRGIGPKIAEKIVNMYGEDTFDVLFNHPEWLAQIKGITEIRAREIGVDFAEKEGVRNILVYCGDTFSPTAAMKIYNAYGRDALEKIRSNPYVLCYDFEELSFKTIDEFALSIGVSLDHNERIKCGIVYVLKFFAARDGHTFLTYDKLVKESSKLLLTSKENVEKQITPLVEEKRIVTVFTSAFKHIYLKNLYDAEQYIAKKLFTIKNSAQIVDSANISKFIEDVEYVNNIKYAYMQKVAIANAMQNGVMVLTGGPGTGKTTVIKGLLVLFHSMGLKCALCAPTGRAAKKMSEATSHKASTIHRLLEVSSGADELGRHHFMRDSSDPLDEDVIIVDETSMIDVLLMESLLKAIKPGSKLILIGDINQLPSVGTGNVLKDVIESKAFSVVELNEIYRQSKDSGIVLNAHLIKNGQIPDIKEKYEDFYFIKKDDESKIPAFIVDLVSKRLKNKYKLNVLTDIQVISPTKNEQNGTSNLSYLLQEALNPKSADKKEHKLTSGKVFRVGDKVMQIKNNYDLEWDADGKKQCGIFNGDIGIIKDIDEENNQLIIDFDERIVKYDFSILDELEIAYAVTVHKSQGSEYPFVILPVVKCASILMTRNLIYTAITRAEKMVILIGSNEIFEYMINNDKQKERNSGLRHFLENYS